jgi:glutathione S-transferase
MLYLGIASRREDPAMIAEVDKLAELLTTLERSIEPNPYFLGEQFYLCDASFCLSYTYVAPLTAAYGKPLLPSQTPKFAKWFEHVASRPSVVEVLAAARTALG